MADETQVVVVLTTLATANDAAILVRALLVRALLERRLVACGTVRPGARSLYRWQGELTEATTGES